MGWISYTSDHSWKKNPDTFSQGNRKKNNVTQGKKVMDAHVLKKIPRPFRSSMVRSYRKQIYDNSDGKLSGAFLASVTYSMIQWHMPKMGLCLIIRNA